MSKNKTQELNKSNFKEMFIKHFKDIIEYLILKVDGLNVNVVLALNNFILKFGS